MFVVEKQEAKSPSAKTITLNPEETKILKDTKVEDVVEESEDKKEIESDRKEEGEEEIELEQAATKIQAAFRGHKTRKNMKQGDTKPNMDTSSQHEPTQEELEAEFRPDDPGRYKTNLFLLQFACYVRF